MQKMQEHTSRLTLKNGKKIAWMEWGSPNGYPILYFHGAGGCRFEGFAFHGPCEQNNFRLIAVDRPGCGESTFPTDSKIASNYNYNSYMSDVAEFCDHLQIPKKDFGVVGTSQGGTFLMGALRYLPQLNYYPKFGVSWVGVPLIPSNLLYNDERYTKVVPKTLTDQMKDAESFKTVIGQVMQRYMSLYAPNKAFDAMKQMNWLSVQDEEALDKTWEMNALGVKVSMTAKEFIKNLIFQEGWKNGHQGSVWGLRIMSNDKWGFNFNDIEQKNIKLYMNYGMYDNIIPCEWGKLYRDYLINECGFNNIQFTEMKQGHFGQAQETGLFENIRKYINEKDKQD